ncbi:MAG: hypothetical protein LBF70_00460, partial [Holosporales bacterium]|nr:hypothetical protein [Holosporales bacterium]
MMALHLKNYLILFLLIPFSNLSAKISLSSNKISYDLINKIVSAEGNVIVKQFQENGNTRELHTSRVEYNQKTGNIKFFGKTEIREPTGEIISADNVEIDKDIKNATIKALVIILKDNSKIKAKDGLKDKNLYILNSASYSPCIKSPCSLPLWDLVADRVTLDSKEKTLTYHNVKLRMKGIPLVFLPYFKHPSFGVKRQSGFLAPIIRSNNDIGFFMGVPYYFVLDRDKDLKLTPFINSKNRGFIASEYRQSFRYGDLKTSSSILAKSKLNKRQWHIDSSFTSYGLNNRNLSIKINRASSVAYKLKYPVDSSQHTMGLLKRKYNESKLLFEAFDKDRFVTADSYIFQTSNRDTAAAIFPHFNCNVIKRDIANGILEFDTDTIYLSRHKKHSSSFNKNLFRSSNRINWNKNIYTEKVIFDFTTGTRTDIQKDKFFPSFSTQASGFLPFINANSIWGPKISVESLKTFRNNKNLKVNEDSVFQNIDDLNFYSINKYGKYGKVEQGEHIEIGIEDSIYNDKRRWLNLFIGRSKNNTVGRFVVKPNDNISIRTRFTGMSPIGKIKTFESGVKVIINNISTEIGHIY